MTAGVPTATHPGVTLTYVAAAAPPSPYNPYGVRDAVEGLEVWRDEEIEMVGTHKHLLKECTDGNGRQETVGGVILTEVGRRSSKGGWVRTLYCKTVNAHSLWY